MIVFLCEEPSIAPVLKAIIREDLKGSTEGIDWQIISFQGKADLEKQFPQRMKSWSYNSPHFIILRDNDGGDCHLLKEKLSARARETGKPFSIRIVCQELESWFIGDLSAVQAAYPASKADQQIKKAKYRAPDRLGNPSEELAKLINVSGKVGRATRISKYLNLAANRSHSFNVLRSKVKELA